MEGTSEEDGAGERPASTSEIVIESAENGSSGVAGDLDGQNVESQALNSQPEDPHEGQHVDSKITADGENVTQIENGAEIVETSGVVEEAESVPKDPANEGQEEGALTQPTEVLDETAAVKEGEEASVVQMEEPAAPPPPDLPPYIPPEVGPDYIPVARLPPLPLPYALNEDGRKIPLHGVESIFLTGSTVEIIGITHLGGDKEGGKLADFVYKEKILQDIQFRGAISDFHVIKTKVLESDFDPLLIKINEEDAYGDGNNFELVLSKEVADVWNYIEEETARRQQLRIDEELRAAIERAKPRSQKKRIVKPWNSRGSELEIEEASVFAKREPLQMVIQRRRREFYQAFKLTDKDAHELWNSSQMECRPFKDPNFDLRHLEQERGVQAVPETSSIAIQAGGGRPITSSNQTVPLELTAVQKQEVLGSQDLSKFFDRVMYQCEEALIQNEVTNIFRDDFASLAEDDAVSGNRKEANITEVQSFTHLTYSKNKVVSAVQWLPHRKGVVAVACTEAASYAERVAKAGRPAHAYILIWNFKDPIHPEFVLQAPFETAAFQYNPFNPDIITAGCYNGQVVMWDMSSEHERIAAMKYSKSKDPDAGDEAQIPVVKWRFSSAVEFSHHSHITDLVWMPGIDCNRGRFTRLGEGSKECNFFATTGGDGKVNFWDIRVDRLMKKGRKAADDSDLVWKPVHTVALVSLLGMELGGTKLCFHHEMEKGIFNIASFDGELLHGQYNKPEGDEHGEDTKLCIQAHVGPVMALERSPFFDNILLSVGDWSFQIWREGQAVPLFQSGYASEYYTCGCWSPTRPAVIYLVDTSGNLEVWDVLDRSHEPSMRATLSSSPFMSMSFMAGSAAPNQTQQLLALGDAAGSLRIVELPRNLRRPVPNEVKLMGNFLERETNRMGDVAARAPARTAALKAAEERKKAKEEAEAAKDKEPAVPQPTAKQVAAKALEFDEKAEAEYYKLEHAFKIKLGLLSEEEPN
ncbi:hypothetical protein CEUSTIGMA_g10493.t1 [Chlamydomonas eustigma]|uniref:Uncharacterized protein n=1 Tax=Chlamydomonas eustigma TaxID=1157962 RepID=A0A250XJ13_9CHLO|nr:hypothetical protein CEUSTIGMA_g10493.t1 [Chlamydomonas eustigma]|eukprot:GAX83067.1 hypothetical protein CEUSTIGMA_g10493.t1 [Chlamydomonas eustigma]